MNYRNFGKLDYKPFALGFGCMRLPTINDESSNIDEKEAIKMIRYGIDNGINYIDTAYPYHGGNSEDLVGKALKNGYRGKVKLATKLPIWLVEKYEDFNKYLDEQLKNLDTDYIDFYLVHALSKDKWEKAKKFGIFDFLNNAIKDGRIKYTGFSFHDNLDLFKEIVDSYDWSFTQIQLNYMDQEYQAGIEGMKYAADRDLAVIVMEPLKGGKLAQNSSQEIKKIWTEVETERTPVEWALRWVWNHPEVSLVLSGMSTMEQVKENIQIANKAEPQSLTYKELQVIDRVKEVYDERTKVGCTECEYCMPCPNGVVIPDIFTLYNDAYMYNEFENSKNTYKRIVDKGRDVSQCVECHSCETSCPQDLSIVKQLKDAHDIMS